MQDAILQSAKVCYDPVSIKDDNDSTVHGQARWNEILVDVQDGKKMQAWKWQAWVEVRGEVEVHTIDGTLQGFIWPRKSCA